MLQFMARQEGFIGHLDVADSTGHWHRSFDFQPANGVADRGSLRFEDDVLVERGVELPYVEHCTDNQNIDAVFDDRFVSHQ